MLGVLSSLVDHSLVSFQPAADGTGRYRLLEYVRQYGGEHLQHRKTLDLTRARHAEYYSRLVKHVVPELSGTAPEPARTILIVSIRTSARRSRA